MLSPAMRRHWKFFFVSSKGDYDFGLSNEMYNVSFTDLTLEKNSKLFLITDETFYSFITYSDCYNAVE